MTTRTAARGRGRKGYPVATWLAAGLIFYLVATSTAKASAPPLPEPLPKPKPTPAPAPTPSTKPKFDGSTVLNGRDARNSPSPKGYDPDLARRAVHGIAEMLRTRGRDRYDRPALAAWQVAAGINGDGLYGGGSRAALEFFGVLDPPAPFFKPTTGNYTPPDQR